MESSLATLRRRDPTKASPAPVVSTVLTEYPRREPLKSLVKYLHPFSPSVTTSSLRPSNQSVRTFFSSWASPWVRKATSSSLTLMKSASFQMLMMPSRAAWAEGQSGRRTLGS
ncbi:unnamed protein product [Triticum turgidum subsp. durum]|uniref:Uncharacterized protein n=1 Tax=Triticum turgidum subsp. durum TaxID=4567 RepID=A0A9R1AT36_TRITD|nr:unnamed protein product [Triticum turgidum subsp. durum]